MKTPRTVILERHQSAEAKLSAIRAEDLAAYTLKARENGPPRRAFDLATTAARFWQETFWPWRRAWLGMAAIWLVILGVSLASGESPRLVSKPPPRPDPGVEAVLRGQKQLLVQLLGPGASPLVTHLRASGPRSAAEPMPAGNQGQFMRPLGAQAIACLPTEGSFERYQQAEA